MALWPCWTLVAVQEASMVLLGGVCDSSLGWGKRKIECNCLNSTGLLLKQLFIIYSGTISALSALKFPDSWRRIRMPCSCWRGWWAPMGARGTGGDAQRKRKMAQFQSVICNYACNRYLALKDCESVDIWTPSVFSCFQEAYCEWVGAWLDRNKETRILPNGESLLVLLLTEGLPFKVTLLIGPFIISYITVESENVSATVCGPGYRRNRQLASAKLSTFHQKLIKLAQIP